jgi:hypothetical protein
MRWWIAVLAACGGEALQPDALEDPGPVEDLALVTGTPLGSGSWLLMIDWAADPNPMLALSPANFAGAPQTVFTARRIWSFGASDDGSAILFSSWDAAQEQRFGITLGDAIQNSFLYGTQTQRARYLGLPGTSWQNVNDECHSMSADGTYVYLCRRYDFTAEGAFSGWRLGRIHTTTRAFEFLRADEPGGPFELNPQELPGGSKILFELRARPPASGASIHTRDLATGTEQLVWDNAARPALAPDGDRVVYADTTAQYRLRQRTLSRPADPPIEVSPTLGTGSTTWSPDGNTIVYTVYDQPQNCDHLERVTWTGTAWSAPERVRDCGQTGEFLADLRWVLVP